MELRIIFVNYNIIFKHYVRELNLEFDKRGQT